MSEEIKALKEDIAKRIGDKKPDSFVGVTVGELAQISGTKLAMPEETTVYKMVKIVRPMLEKAPAK